MIWERGGREVGQVGEDAGFGGMRLKDRGGRCRSGVASPAVVVAADEGRPMPPRRGAQQAVPT